MESVAHYDASITLRNQWHITEPVGQ